MLYIAMAEGNQIWRVDVGNLEGKDKIPILVRVMPEKL